MESEGEGKTQKKPWPSHLSSHGFFVDPFVVCCQRLHHPVKAPQRGERLRLSICASASASEAKSRFSRTFIPARPLTPS